MLTAHFLKHHVRRYGAHQHAYAHVCAVCSCVRKLAEYFLRIQTVIVCQGEPDPRARWGELYTRSWWPKNGYWYGYAVSTCGVPVGLLRANEVCCELPLNSFEGCLRPMRSAVSYCGALLKVLWGPWGLPWAIVELFWRVCGMRGFTEIWRLGGSKMLS